jgi:hypothetical protein
MRSVFMLALALYMLVPLALAMATVLGVAGASNAPMHPTPGLGL